MQSTPVPTSLNGGTVEPSAAISFGRDLSYNDEGREVLTN
jgi:hypothetical protein